jgi:uncharacterized membrane protein
MADNRPSPKAVGLLLAVFLLGCVFGGLVTHLSDHLLAASSARRPRVIDRMTQQLQLTPDQKTTIQTILTEGHQRIDAVFKQSQQQARPQYEAIHNDTRARIRQLLTPAQQPKFDDFLRQLDAEHRARQNR